MRFVGQGIVASKGGSRRLVLLPTFRRLPSVDLDGITLAAGNGHHHVAAAHGAGGAAALAFGRDLRVLPVLCSARRRDAVARAQRRAIDVATAEGIARDAFEFQMLYGVRRDLQEQLVKDGWGMRVYIPFGTEWYPYLMRRLAERPANAIFILKNLFRR